MSSKEIIKVVFLVEIFVFVQFIINWMVRMNQQLYKASSYWSLLLLKMKQKYNPFGILLNHQIQVSCNTLTSDSRSISDLLYMIPSGSNYHVVPLGDTQSVYIDPWYVTKNIIQTGLSKNKILDVTLPLELEQGSNQKNKLARFIFFNNRLIGIRPEMKQSNQRRNLNTFPLPSEMSQILKQKSVPFGQFYLHTENTKIAFIFQSQLKYFNTILQEYSYMGCQVFSVVSNLQFSSQNNQNLHEKIKLFSYEHHRLMIYSSMLYAPTQKNLYTGGSFISFNKQILQQSSISIYEYSETLLGRISVNDMRTKIDYKKISQRNYNCIQEISIQYFMRAKQSEKKRKQSDSSFVLKVDNIKKYHLWYLFNKINNRSPFFINDEVDNYTKQLVRLIFQICQEISKRNNKTVLGENLSVQQLLQKMLVIYNTSETQPTQDLLKQIVIKLPQNYFKINNNKNSPAKLQNKEMQIMLSNFQKINNIIFYSRNERQIKFIQNMISSSTDNRIGLYKELGWLIDQKVLGFRSGEFIQQNVDAVQKEVEEYLKRSTSHKQMFTRIYTAYPSEIKRIYTMIIPKILRANIKNDKLQDYYLGNNWNLHSFQQGVFQKDIKSTAQKYRTQDQKLENKIKQIKQIKSIKKENCHMCSVQFSQNLVLTCQCCNSFCLDCLSLTNNQNTEQFNKDCLVCKKKCPCKQCALKYKVRDFMHKCHRCESLIIKVSSTSLWVIQCSNKQCNYSYCGPCIQQIQKIKLKINATSTWKCFVCRKICPCPLCLHRQELQELKKKKGIYQIQQQEQIGFSKTNQDNKQNMDVEDVNDRPGLQKTTSLQLQFYQKSPYKKLNIHNFDSSNIRDRSRSRSRDEEVQKKKYFGAQTKSTKPVYFYNEKFFHKKMYQKSTYQNQRQQKRPFGGLQSQRSLQNFDQHENVNSSRNKLSGGRFTWSGQSDKNPIENERNDDNLQEDEQQKQPNTIIAIKKKDRVEVDY